jgi:hypothetical protein
MFYIAFVLKLFSITTQPMHVTLIIILTYLTITNNIYNITFNN